ncbi:MAG: PIN domain-containing protein [Dysgonamonadaceae bacterium]|jgi:predicted nucleic acid-binding protein|nr:PIN domain-containing protein [Dysgonamonadaceae bacterium]
MKKVLLDTNIVLDFVLKRKPFYENAQAIFFEIVKGNMEGYITASMATDIFYLLQKTNGKKFAKDTFADLLVIVDVLTVYREDVYIAQQWEWDDFEDALQTQVAIHGNMDAIVTRNITDYKKAQHLDIVQPADFIQYLRK